MHGAAIVNNSIIKTISAVRPSRGSGQTRAKKRRGGENIRWKRVTEGFEAAIEELRICPPSRLDDLAKAIAASQKLIAPVTRLVYFGHLTTEQGIAARRYADVMRKFERYHLPPIQRTPKSAALDPMRGEDQELERVISNGTLPQYEASAKKAMREYRKVTKVLDRFADPVTGRNFAKNALDDLCMADIEPPAQHRRDIALVLSAIAAAFGQPKGDRK